VVPGGVVRLHPDPRPDRGLLSLPVRRRDQARLCEGAPERALGRSDLPRGGGRGGRLGRLAHQGPGAHRRTGAERPMTRGMDAEASHEHRGLHRSDLLDDPIDQFLEWLAEAGSAGIALPNAVALATTGLDARPSVRHVLVRGVDGRGFVFYTNHESRKGRQLAENPHAAMVVHCRELDRQVSIAGLVDRVDEAEADAYFATR